METLEVLRQDGIVTVTMNRPSKKNAANGTMWAELKQTFLEVGSNPDDRVMVSPSMPPSRSVMRWRWSIPRPVTWVAAVS